MTQRGITNAGSKPAPEELKSQAPSTPQLRHLAYLLLGTILALAGAVATFIAPSAGATNRWYLIGLATTAAGMALFWYGVNRQKGYTRTRTLTMVIGTAVLLIAVVYLFPKYLGY